MAANEDIYKRLIESLQSQDNRKSACSASQILPNVWISDEPYAADHGHEYTHVLNMARSVPNRQTANQQYLHIQLLDLDDIKPHLDKIYSFVNTALESNGKVLVHCAMGINRSAAACLAVICKRCGMEVKEALLVLKSHAPRTNPCLWFQQQIQEWLDGILLVEHQDNKLLDFKQRLQQRKAKGV